jgi:hypothetical protein
MKSQLAKQPKTTAETGRQVVWSEASIELYGYIKADASYDTSRVDEGNYARWVESPGVDKGNDDEQFNLTARQSRFGLNISGPDIGSTKTTGRVEIDFYGGGPEYRANPMMRHAYLKVEWPKIDFSILAGQTSDTISPLFPNMLNYTVGWWAGNPGYRRPQVRFTKGFSLGKDVRFQLEVAPARTIGHNEPFNALVDTGEDAAFPSVQSRGSISFPLLTSKKTILGVSGHWGREEYDYDTAGHSVDIETWSANLDLTFPILDWLMFQGEFWTGRDLDAYLAGIGQGIVVVTDKNSYIIPLTTSGSTTPIAGTFLSAFGIAATGGWGALNCGPFGPWRINLGGGLDSPHDGDVPSKGRTQNVSVWGNVTYDITKAVQVGVELSYWNTKYKDLESGESIRVQTSMIYRF